MAPPEKKNKTDPDPVKRENVQAQTWLEHTSSQCKMVDFGPTYLAQSLEPQAWILNKEGVKLRELYSSTHPSSGETAHDLAT